MKCNCKECGKEINLVKEDAYNKPPIGVLCEDCYGRWISP
jgi:hypothetical protein